MHPLSAIVTGLLVTSGAAGALLGGPDLGLPPIHFGGQDPDAGGNATGNETGNETGNATADNETVEEESTNSTSENATADNATADNETHDHSMCDYDDHADCYVYVSDYNDVLVEGGGSYTLEVTDAMDFLNIFVRAYTYSPGLGDEIDITVRDPTGDVLAEVHHGGGTGSFLGDAVVQVDLDRAVDGFESGTYTIDVAMSTLYGSYDVHAEASCEDGYYWY